MKKSIVILALLFSFLFADGCNIPGYLRTEGCQEKNVLFSWKWVLFDSIRSSLPTGFKKIDDNNVTELLNKVSNGTAGLVVNFGTSLHFGTYFRLVDNLVFGANTGIGIGIIGWGYVANRDLALSNFKEHVFIPVETLLKYYFNLKSFSIGAGFGGDISFKNIHTMRAFIELGWPVFSLRFGWQHQFGVGYDNPAKETIYSAIVFGY